MKTTENGNGAILEIALEKIRPGATNPRTDFSTVPELAQNIEAVGLGQAIVVRPLPKYKLQEPDLTTSEWRVLRAVTAAAGAQGEPPKGGTPTPPAGKWDVIESWPALAKASEQIAKQKLEELSKHEFEIIMGERRWRAFGHLKRKTIPAVVRSDLSDKEAFDLQLAENLQRESLNAMEEARGYATAMEKFGESAEELAKRIGKSRSHVFSLLRLVKLDEKSREAIQKYNLPDSIAVKIPTVPEKKRLEAIEHIATRGEYDQEKDHSGCMSARRAEEYLAQTYRQDLKRAGFDPKEKDLLAGVPTCDECPKRSGNLALDGNPNVCTDPGCYQRKTTAKLNKKLDAAREKGLEVIAPSKSESLFWYGNDLKSGSGFVKPGAECDADKKGRTFKQLVGDTVKPVVALDKHGNTLQLFKEEDVALALKEKGIKAKTPSAGSGGPAPKGRFEAEERRQAEKEKESRAIWKVAEPQIRQAAVAGKTDRKFLQFLVGLIEPYSRRQILKRYESSDKELSKLDEGTLRCLLMEEIGYHDEDPIDYHGELEPAAATMAEFYGVDLKKIAAELKAGEKKTEQEATEKTEKKKPAKAGTPTPKGKKKKGKK